MNISKLRDELLPQKTKTEDHAHIGEETRQLFKTVHEQQLQHLREFTPKKKKESKLSHMLRNAVQLIKNCKRVVDWPLNWIGGKLKGILFKAVMIPVISYGIKKATETKKEPVKTYSQTYQQSSSLFDRRRSATLSSSASKTSTVALTC